MSREHSLAPPFESLPQARPRFGRGGNDCTTFEVAVKVVTPILGGGTQPRAVDDVDVIRVPTVRGHLRFWWRALYGHEFQTAEELFERESLLWGHAAGEGGGRSAVRVQIQVEKTSDIDGEDSRLNDSREGRATPGAYALWTARAERERGQIRKPAAPRYRPGIRFRLGITVPVIHEATIRNTVRAWVVFGGYGSRTRRGLGSFTVVEDVESWLPRGTARDAFTELFGTDIFATPVRQPGDVPWLAGAALYVGTGNAVNDATAAWSAALDWLREFRQGTSGDPGNRAREPGRGMVQPQRPSLTNWPEPDKIRHLCGKTKGHSPRHNNKPAWPRAGFGLPIVGQFQKRGRQNEPLDEPGPFQLRWRLPKPNEPGEFEEYDRLASPLIVKALPLADGTFAPGALWLNRAYPRGGEVVLYVQNELVEPSAAPFGRLVAPGDKPRFAALAGKESLRVAFLDWLKATERTVVVAP